MICIRVLSHIYLIIFIANSFSLGQSNVFIPHGKYLGYSFSFTSPYYIVKEDKYIFDPPPFNTGLNCSFDLGATFKSGLTLSINPFLVFSNFKNRQYKYELYTHEDNILISSENGHRKYSHLSFALPIYFELPLWKFKIGIGGYMLKPIWSSGIDFSEGYEYFHYSDIYNDYIPNLIPVKLGGTYNFSDLTKYAYYGITGKLSIPVKVDEQKSWMIIIEYFQSLTLEYEYLSSERLISIGLSKRIYRP
ncbi:MAG: hypothetical protein ABI761_17450 [Saprospiraceae bacterium]